MEKDGGSSISRLPLDLLCDKVQVRWDGHDHLQRDKSAILSIQLGKKLVAAWALLILFIIYHQRHGGLFSRADTGPQSEPVLVHLESLSEKKAAQAAGTWEVPAKQGTCLLARADQRGGRPPP